MRSVLIAALLLAGCAAPAPPPPAEPSPSVVGWMTLAMPEADREYLRERGRRCDEDPSECNLYVIGESVPVKPQMFAVDLSPQDRWVVRSGHRGALAQLDAHPACSEMFRQAGLDGAAVLAEIHYRPPATPEERRRCRRALALARAGQPDVVICPGFHALTARDAAAALLHEALHTIGLEEAPYLPGAPTSAEITADVVQRCALQRPRR